MGTVNRDPAWWGEPERKADALFTELWQSVGIYTGIPCSQVTLKKTDDGWLLVVSARSASRGALVCFIEGRTPGECWGELVARGSTKEGLNWKKDRYHS